MIDDAGDAASGGVETGNPELPVSRGPRWFMVVDEVVAEFMGDGAERWLLAQSNHSRLRPGATVASFPSADALLAETAQGEPARRHAVAGMRPAPAVERHCRREHCVKTAHVIDELCGPRPVGR